MLFLLLLLYGIPLGILSWLGLIFMVDQYDKGTKFGLWCHKFFN